MKTHGGVEVWLLVFLTTTSEMSGYVSAPPSALRKKNPAVPQSQYGHCSGEINLYPHNKLIPNFCGRPSHSLVTILTCGEMALGTPEAGLDTAMKEGITPSPGIEPRFSGPAGRSLVAMLTSREIHRIAGVLDFIHRPDFNSYKKKDQTRRFGNWICFRPQMRGDTYSVGSLRKS
jgi:hypothetical protein